MAKRNWKPKIARKDKTGQSLKLTKEGQHELEVFNRIAPARGSEITRVQSSGHTQFRHSKAIVPRMERERTKMMKLEKQLVVRL